MKTDMKNIFSIVIYLTIIWIVFNVFMYCQIINNSDRFESLIMQIIISSLFCMDSTTQHIRIIINHIAYCQSNYDHRIPLYNLISLLLSAIIVVIRTLDTIACNLSNSIIVTSSQPRSSEATCHVSLQQQQRLENRIFFVFSLFFLYFFFIFGYIPIGKYFKNHIYFCFYSSDNKNLKW